MATPFHLVFLYLITSSGCKKVPILDTCSAHVVGGSGGQQALVTTRVGVEGYQKLICTGPIATQFKCHKSHRSNF